MSNVALKLAGLVADMKGAKIISIDTETPVILTGGKSNLLNGRVTKLAIGHNVMIFQNKTASAYGNMVERRLIDEDKDPTAFELKPRKWGHRIKDSPFIEHNGELYFEVIFLRAAKQIEYFLDGHPVAREELPGLREPKEAEQGGLDNKVILRDFKCRNIRAITIDHKKVVLT